MNFVVTDEMVDLTVLVGVIFGIIAAGFIAYGEIQRRRGRKGGGSDAGGKRRASKSRRGR